MSGWCQDRSILTDSSGGPRVVTGVELLQAQALFDSKVNIYDVGSFGVDGPHIREREINTGVADHINGDGSVTLMSTTRPDFILTRIECDMYPLIFDGGVGDTYTVGISNTISGDDPVVVGSAILVKQGLHGQFWCPTGCVHHERLVDPKLLHQGREDVADSW